MAAFPAIETPLYTASGVEYEFLYENYQEQFTTRATNSVIKARVAWDEAADFLWDILGWTDADQGDTTFNRYLPLAHPEVGTLFCTNAVLAAYPSSSKGGANQGITSEGGSATSLNLGEWCIYQLTFTRLPYYCVPNETIAGEAIPELFRYCIVTKRPRAREFTVNSYALKPEGSADSAAIKTPAFIMDREQDILITLCEVPASVYPKTGIDACLGNINSAELEMPVSFDDPAIYETQTFPIGTLLFRGVANEITTYQGPNGQWYYDLPYVFTYRPNGWRKLPKPTGDGSYVTMVRIGITPTKYMYDTADFSALFKPEP